MAELRVERLDRDDDVPRGLDVPLKRLREVGEGEDRTEDEEDRDEPDHEVEETHGALTELLEEERGDDKGEEPEDCGFDDEGDADGTGEQ